MRSDPGKISIGMHDLDTPMGVSRATLRRLAQALGVDEPTAVHIALAQLRNRILPRYERDDGPLTEAQLRDARYLISQDRVPTSSLVVPSGRGGSDRPG